MVQIARIARLVLLLLAAVFCLGAALHAQNAAAPTLEYQVKAAYIYNFTKYVEWPPAVSGTGALTICVAGRNPFGAALNDLVRGEHVGDRALTVRVLLEPADDCQVVFVPQGAATSAYLRTARLRPVLTIGETDDFIAQGGIVNFVRDGSNVRFEIDPEAAARANLRVSSRLLRLARQPGRPRR